MTLMSAITRYREQKHLYIKEADGEVCSYPAFFERVEDFRHALDLKLVRGDVVLIDRPKSIDTAALAVACILSNYSYSFIDPDLPEARKALIKSAVRPALHIAAGGGIAQQLESAVRSKASGGDHDFLGTIVFTSGSTGNPKGVYSSYSALDHYVESMVELMGSTPETWLSICPAHFDVFQLDILVQLARGANIVLSPNNLMPQQYLNIIDTEGVTEVLFIATLLKMIVRTSGNWQPKTLKSVYFGGEGCPIPVLEQAIELFDGVTFCQFYGPTENCNNTTAFRFTELVPSQTGYMPLGRAIKHVGLAVVDAQGKPCSAGQSGEIVITGNQLFSGYLDVTSGQFAPHSGPYRSGDVGFFDDDGNLWFEGRRDDIVKVNGNRVSLVEINNKILEFVANATVSTVVREANGFSALVSGVHSPEPFDSAKLIEHLTTSLPRYSIPSKVMPLPESVVTTLSTGKTNYQIINEYLRS